MTQSVVTFAGVAMVRPEGKVSVNDRLDFAVESALVIEKIRVATWPGATVAGSNFLVSCGVDKYRALTTPAFTEPDIVTTFEESVDGAPASVVVPLPPVVTVEVFTLKALVSEKTTRKPPKIRFEKVYRPSASVNC